MNDCRTILVSIETLPSGAMRYDTDGDWHYNDAGTLVIQVADHHSPAEQRLIALHEWIEAMLCQARGVSQEAVDAFDMAYAGDGEPGDDPRAPYRREHRFAALIDHMVAHELGIDGYGRVDWEEPCAS